MNFGIMKVLNYIFLNNALIFLTKSIYSVNQISIATEVGSGGDKGSVCIPGKGSHCVVTGKRSPTDVGRAGNHTPFKAAPASTQTRLD